ACVIDFKFGTCSCGVFFVIPQLCQVQATFTTPAEQLRMVKPNSWSRTCEIDELRSYIVRTFGWETWRQTSAQIQETITQIRQYPDSGHMPAELEGFVDERFRQTLSSRSRIIYEVQDDTVFIHLVVDTRRDLPALLQRIVLRLM
uniref:type II toxin-antitoxin system RelE/ParE family toxin n=3 Tax=Paraburkholderia mimosarum TaxID=312026 RepID=UPI001FC7E46B